MRHSLKAIIPHPEVPGLVIRNMAGPCAPCLFVCAKDLLACTAAVSPPRWPASR